MVAYRFEDADWDNTPKQTQHIGDLRFRQLFTDTQWRELPLPVRNRFGRRVGIGEAIIYKGHVITSTGGDVSSMAFLNLSARLCRSIHKMRAQRRLSPSRKRPA